MDTMMKPVQNGRGRRRQWSSEQKLTMLQEWQAGVLLEEICRKYAVNAAQMYRWKRSLDQGLKESGKLVPKSLVGGLQKRVDELERALGRKALEVDVLKNLRAQGAQIARGNIRWLTRTTGCSVAMVCRVLGKPRRWLYYRRRSRRGRPLRRPELEESVRQLLGASPTSYGYRRIHALLKRRGVACNPKTVWRVLRRRGWLSTSRRRIIRSGRRHEGRVQVSEPNRRWASDITRIRAWDGQRGRLAIMIDCADRVVLAWRFAMRMTADDLTEMLREAIWHRFGGARTHARGIEFLSDNGPEYASHRFPPFVRAMGLIPCHTPRRSPESNGLAEAFFGSFKRDYVYQACLETVEDVARQLPGWIKHYNHQAPHSALGMQSPAECYAGWLVRNKTRLSKIKWGSTEPVSTHDCRRTSRFSRQALGSLYRE